MKRIAASLLLFSLMGCCPQEEVKKAESTPVPAQAVEATPVPAATPRPVAAPVMKKMSYQVKNGDTLWGISETVYGSNWYWPSLYNGNRDQISDHDKIVPGEVITFERPITQGEKDSATTEAKNTKAL
jgi:nucleoid-associated protein YgaU